MRAVVIPCFGGPEVLVWGEVPRPTPGRGEVLVRVHATAVNRADLLQRLGRYPAPPDVPANIPNLLKGASGQAIQNLNAVFGFDETTGLASLHRAHP